MLKTLAFKDEALKYEIHGSGLPVLLLHGFMEDRRIWDPLLDGMKNSFQWIMPDLPGSGDSPFNPSLSGLKDFAEGIHLILQEENIQELVLIGHSMGGYISLAFAEKYPEMIRGLGLFHSSAYPDSSEKKESRDKNISFIKKNGAGPFIEQAIPGLYAESFKTEYTQEIRNQIDRYINFNPDSLIMYLDAMKQRPKTTTVLQTIIQPVLFIMGEEDKAVPLKDMLEQSCLPRISYIHILTRTAHMGMIENTGLCRSIIERFLEQIPD